MNIDTSTIKLVALDMDGTLTQHRTPLEPQNKAALDRIGQRYSMVMVGAGSCMRIHRQLNGYPMDVIGNYGMEEGVYDPSTGTLNVTSRERLCPLPPDEVIRRVTALRREWGFEAYTGDTVEFHQSGMLTFALLGTKANIQDKLTFDPHRERRRPMLGAVRAAFPDYTVFLGGSSSFDIVPKPYDKHYALVHYCNERGILANEVVFFGDDYLPGGNDEQVFASPIACVPVDDYRHFPAISAQALRLDAHCD